MTDEYRLFEQRKADHIEFAQMQSNQADYNALDNVTLVHEALPDLDFDSITINGKRFEKQVLKPFFVASMTAGHKHALEINERLMTACSQTDWAMGVGSQRRELMQVNAAAEWQTLRHKFPNISLFGNLGIAQLITTPIEHIRRLVEALQAEAFIVHCNPLQECIQPEGTPSFQGCWEALTQLVKQMPVPIVVKETGCGFSSSTLNRLNEIGVAAVDVSGFGGTHWGRIEGLRAIEATHQQAAQTFRNWGISTVQSVYNAKMIKPAYEVWGSGGVRHGLDAAKLFALGVSMVGFAKLMLDAALISAEAVVTAMTTIEYELKVAMFCTGSKVLADLQEKACP